MPAPFKQEFDLGGIRITSLVMDETEFVALCKEFIGIFPGFDEAAAQKCIKAKIIPGMGKGSKTVQFFVRYGITTDTMSIIVRGAGDRIMDSILGSDPERN